VTITSPEPCPGSGRISRAHLTFPALERCQFCNVFLEVEPNDNEEFWVLPQHERLKREAGDATA